MPEAAMTCAEEFGEAGGNKGAVGFGEETKFNGSIPSGYHTISRLVQHYDNATITTNIPFLIYSLSTLNNILQLLPCEKPSQILHHQRLRPLRPPPGSMRRHHHIPDPIQPT